MATSYAIPETTKEKLRCSRCKNVLFCAPICIKEEKTVCGKCDSAGSTGIRDKILEGVLAESRFPCVNREYGCKEWFVFDHEKEHEEVCQYKPFDCPNSDECKWRGTGHNVAVHFKKTHRKHFNSNQFSASLVGNGQCNRITEICTGVESIYVPILIQYYCEDDFLHLDVMYFRDGFLKDISYQLTLTNANQSEKLQIARCKEYVVGDAKGTPARKISLKNLPQNNKDFNFKFTFEANCMKLRENKQEGIKCCYLDSESGIDIRRKCCQNKMSAPYDVPEYALIMLRCSSCEEVLSCGPIRYYLPNTKDFGFVKSAEVYCGRCSFDNNRYLRNFILEEVLAEARFPCVNRAHGCEEKFLFNHEEEHYDVCQYKPIDCPISDECEWRVTGHNIAAHFKKTHENNFFSNPSLQMNLVEKRQCKYITEISSGVESIKVPILIHLNCKDDSLLLAVKTFKDGFLKDISYQLTLTSLHDKTVSLKLQTTPCKKYSKYWSGWTSEISLKDLPQKHKMVLLKFTFEATCVQLHKIEPECLKCCVHDSECGWSSCGRDVCQKCCRNKDIH